VVTIIECLGDALMRRPAKNCPMVRSYSQMLKGRVCQSSTLLRTHNACEMGTV
jgi:hypothetical protein